MDMFYHGSNFLFFFFSNLLIFVTCENFYNGNLKAVKSKAREGRQRIDKRLLELFNPWHDGGRGRRRSIKGNSRRVN